MKTYTDLLTGNELSLSHAEHDQKSHGGGSSKHSVKLPKNRKKATIPQVATALAEMGYALGPAHTDLKKGTTSYMVKLPEGGQKRMTTDEIKELVY